MVNAPLVAPMQRDLFGGGASVTELPPVPAPQPLDGESWLVHRPGWLPSADAVFDDLVVSVAWESHERPMYDRVVAEPRLSAGVDVSVLPADTARLLADAREALSDAVGRRLSPPFGNLYRDGSDSVAWHGDRVGRGRAQAIVALVAVGERRTFLLRPTGGGPSRRFELGRGDLLIMGGACQRDWQHCVPKTRRPVGPRISLTWRHNAA